MSLEFCLWYYFYPSIAFSFFFLIQRFIKLPASSLLELLIDKTIFKPCR